MSMLFFHFYLRCHTPFFTSYSWPFMVISSLILHCFAHFPCLLLHALLHLFLLISIIYPTSHHPPTLSCALNLHQINPDHPLVHLTYFELTNTILLPSFEPHVLISVHYKAFSRLNIFPRQLIDFSILSSDISISCDTNVTVLDFCYSGVTLM